MEELTSEDFAKIEELLSNEPSEVTVKEIDMMTSVLEAYTQQVNTTNERLEK